MSELKKFSNITNKQIQSYGVQALADRPNVSSQYGASGLTPAQLKLWFDKLATFLAGRVNDIGDVLSSDEAGSYIRIPLDDAGVGTLSALVESFANGTFAHKILNVYPSVSAYHMVSLQEALYGIAQFMGETEEELGRMKGVGGASFLIGVDNGTHVLSFSLLNEKGEVLKSDSADFSYLVNAARAAAAVEADRASTEADRARDEADRASSEAINALADAKESGVFDGVSVTHVWDGSKLIVTSASGTSESDLRGPEGKRGETGKGFEISKTYASVLQMHADYGNPAVPLYGFVLIDTGNVDDEDNAKLFVKQDDGYQFLIDLSGSEGIKGERGYSAYDTAVQLGFIGSEDEWIASLKKPAEDAASEARASEKVRDANENARIADENIRKLNEAAREDAEHQRRAISEDIVTRAENALTLANDAKAEAILSASAAGESERNARSSETAAESARLAAERARDDAEAIVGGDFASTAYVDQKSASAESNAKTAAQGYANTAESNAKSYADQKISEIPTPDVSGQIGTHNTNASAHNDIRLLIEGLTTRLNTLANSDDTTLDQMAEVVAYIKSNRDLIAQITTNKVNVGDIVNDLDTNVSNKPLSAAQGVALKALIDAITIPVTSVNGKAGAVMLGAEDVGAAKLASPNNMLHNGNEFTFIPDGYEGQIYINHRTASGQANGNVSNYYFGDGKGGLATFIAGYFKGKFQGDTSRPIYNGEEAAMLSDVTAERAGALPTSGGTVNGAITIQRANYPGFTLKNTTVNGEFAVTEADDGTAVLQNNSDVGGANNYAALYIKPVETGINNVLQIGFGLNGGWQGAVVLHSQNFTDHINPTSIGLKTEALTYHYEDGSTRTVEVYVK